MNRTTGGTLEGLAHVRQSVADILSTPVGSRVMRREYGSRLYELVDTPLNAATRLAMIAATAQALRTWEPRLRVVRVQVALTAQARARIDITAVYRETGATVVLEGILL
jgi:phage baseplate assembly protein W